MTTRVSPKTLSIIALGIAATLGFEGFVSKPMIPTQGDKPTIGYGSTVYEDGTPVKLTDPPITRERALQIASAHKSKDEKMFQDSLGDTLVTPGEYKLYMDFTYQYGIGAWRSGSPLKALKRGDYVGACNALLDYRNITSTRNEGPGWVAYQFQNGKSVKWKYDCSTPGNKVCRGVWNRQLERHKTCMREQG